MVQAHLVERVPDPSDGRARLVRFSAAGRRGLLDGLAMLQQLEGEIAADVGEETWRGLRVGVLALLGWLEARQEG